MTYRCVVATRRGGPEVLEVEERTVRPPSRGEVRIRVLAAPACRPDVQARTGQTPFAPRVPFVPGYAVVGTVDAVGGGVRSAEPGRRVAALTMYGGYTEVAYVRERLLVPVPASVEPALAAPVVLNYMVAYQTLHRTAKVRSGGRVVVIGASGGVGTALLDLGRRAKLTMYGVASGDKRSVLAGYGVMAIDYRSDDVVAVVRAHEPAGVDAVLDGVGGSYLRRGLRLLRRGGVLVAFGNPLTVGGLLRMAGTTLATDLLPNGHRIKGYGTTLSRLRPRPFMEDWATLFQLLEQGHIQPLIARRFPIVQAAAANALLESGGIAGNVVLERATAPGSAPPAAAG